MNFSKISSNTYNKISTQTKETRIFPRFFYFTQHTPIALQSKQGYNKGIG